MNKATKQFRQSLFTIPKDNNVCKNKKVEVNQSKNSKNKNTNKKAEIKNNKEIPKQPNSSKKEPEKKQSKPPKTNEKNVYKISPNTYIPKEDKLPSDTDLSRWNICYFKEISTYPPTDKLIYVTDGNVLGVAKLIGKASWSYIKFHYCLTKCINEQEERFIWWKLKED